MNKTIGNEQRQVIKKPDTKKAFVSGIF